MNKVLEYRKLISAMFFYENRKMTEQEDEVLDKLDKLWYSATEAEEEAMNNSVTFLKGEDYKRFNDAWRQYHADGKHKSFYTVYKTWDNVEVNVRNTNLRPIHYLIHGIVNGLGPREIFAPSKIDGERTLVETVGLFRETYRKHLMASLEPVFGDTITEEHIERIRIFLKAVI